MSLNCFKTRIRSSHYHVSLFVKKINKRVANNINSFIYCLLWKKLQPLLCTLHFHRKCLIRYNEYNISIINAKHKEWARQKSTAPPLSSLLEFIWAWNMHALTINLAVLQSTALTGAQRRRSLRPYTPITHALLKVSVSSARQIIFTTPTSPADIFQKM